MIHNELSREDVARLIKIYHVLYKFVLITIIMGERRRRRKKNNLPKTGLRSDLDDVFPVLE